MEKRVRILGLNRTEERIITFYVYPANSTATPYVVSFLLILIISFYIENLWQRIVPIFYPVDNKIFTINPVAQISLSYENEEMLKEINKVVINTFS